MTEVRYIEDRYGGGRIVRAFLAGEEIAFLQGCPRGISLRWIGRQHTDRNYIEIHPDEQSARAAIEQWHSGLQIVPWDAQGQPEHTV